MPAISRVRTEINKSEGLKKSQVARNGKKRIIKKIPAVTKVEECTSADTGVGAAIAAGSHAEKGIWALFVNPATIIAIATMKVRWKSHISVTYQCPWRTRIPIEIKIITSPIRLAKMVSIPAAKDFVFW